MAQDIPAIDWFGWLRLSQSTREDLIKFLMAAEEIEMLVRMPTKLDKDIVFLLFTYSKLPENIKVTMRVGKDGENDLLRLMKKEFI